MPFGVESMDRQTFVNNVTGLAKAAKIFEVLKFISLNSLKSKQLEEFVDE
jgi:hypothetical protein